MQLRSSPVRYSLTWPSDTVPLTTVHFLIGVLSPPLEWSACLHPEDILCISSVSVVV
jgi:hypothetical protein